MKRVALLVTGKTEEVLHHALKRLFPIGAAEFVMRPILNGFTSAALGPAPILSAGGDRTMATPSELKEIAAALVGEVLPGRRDEKPPDLVVLVDDLELVNQAWPERALGHLREAVRSHIEQHPWPSAKSRDLAYERVRQRCSFHLLAPMVEAYFFAEAAALTRAGAKRPSLVDPSIDLESFEVNDPDFLSWPNHPPDGKKLPPWATPDRKRHPKRYTQFLCDPAGTVRRAYFEEKGGRAALRDLDWSAVLAPPEHVRFVRSLIHDIADALDEHEVAQRYEGTTHPLTWPPPRDKLLRNI